jgi:hypothetical protein
MAHTELNLREWRTIEDMLNARHRKLNLTGPMSFPHPEAILL